MVDAAWEAEEVRAVAEEGKSAAGAAGGYAAAMAQKGQSGRGAGALMGRVL